MKLTLAYPHESAHPTTRISVSIPGDRPPLDRVLDDLVFPALRAAGYPEHELRSRLGMDRAEPPQPDLGEPADPRFGFRARDGSWVPVPEGFELVGYSIDDPNDRVLDDFDVRYAAAGGSGCNDVWDPTPYANGYDVYYAARIGSEAHRYLMGLAGKNDLVEAVVLNAPAYTGPVAYTNPAPVVVPLEGPPRSAEELARNARELDAVAPTPGDKFRLMFGADDSARLAELVRRVECVIGHWRHCDWFIDENRFGEIVVGVDAADAIDLLNFLQPQNQD